ncbi:hypothetical protein CEXT_163721 [Caerostris extrusa]|uniref:Uncharacterized protein n=1 Tax=Caerostris extrusa TaxID=172846 RepID=A0AAV4SGI2_CAEEX|nr:hypothetical protein CEXT_163721 [Caerostris extrusa]
MWLVNIPLPIPFAVERKYQLPLGDSEGSLIDKPFEYFFNAAFFIPQGEFVNLTWRVPSKRDNNSLGPIIYEKRMDVSVACNNGSQTFIYVSAPPTLNKREIPLFFL